MANDFVRQRLILNAIAAGLGQAPERFHFAALSEDDVRDERSTFAKKGAPTKLYRELSANIAVRQAIGNGGAPQVAANDNQIKANPEPKVRKSTGKYVRGSFAEIIPAVLEYRNRPDSPPDPLQSNWCVEPSIVVIEQDVEEDGEVAEKYAEDLLLEITPSLKRIFHEVEHGSVVRGHPATDEGGKPISKQGSIASIGKLRFSDGGNHERAYKRGPDGDVVAYMRKMPPGAMLGTTEKTGAAHGGGSPNVVSISNTNLTGRLLGWEPSEDDKPSKKPVNYRAYSPATRKRRTGKSLTSAQSSELIARAIANTPVMPSVTVCPPGVAAGTARFCDQFVGMKIGSTGKGGAPNWVDFFTAGRDHGEWMETIGDLDTETSSTLAASVTAANLAQLGFSGHRRTLERQARKRLVAANDNLVAAAKRKAG